MFTRHHEQNNYPILCQKSWYSWKSLDFLRMGSQSHCSVWGVEVQGGTRHSLIMWRLWRATFSHYGHCGSLTDGCSMDRIHGNHHVCLHMFANVCQAHWIPTSLRAQVQHQWDRLSPSLNALEAEICQAWRAQCPISAAWTQLSPSFFGCFLTDSI